MDYFRFIDCVHLIAALSELDLTSYLPSSGVQLGYTVIFGWYAAFLFIRTGLTHSFMLSPVLLFSCYSCWNSFSGFRIEVSMFIIHTWLLVHAISCSISFLDNQICTVRVMITSYVLVWYSILQKHEKQNRMAVKWWFHVPYFIFVFSTIFWYIRLSLWIVTWLDDCACTLISIWFYDMMDGDYRYFTVSNFNMDLITRFHCWLTLKTNYRESVMSNYCSRLL